MEPHAIIAVWETDGKLTVYDKNQGVKSARTAGAGLQTGEKCAGDFDLHRRGVRVGYSCLAAYDCRGTGCEGSKASGQACAGQEQMFTSVGYRPYTLQKVKMGADRSGKLTAMVHEGAGQTSTYEEHLERTVLGTRVMYACPAVQTRYRLLNLDVRARPRGCEAGDATGMFALESAMDELAFELKIDPLEFRMRNYAESDPERNLPWSAKSLRECYELGAEKFGWKKRHSEPGSMTENGMLVGYGMASSLYGFHRHPSRPGL